MKRLNSCGVWQLNLHVPKAKFEEILSAKQDSEEETREAIVIDPIEDFIDELFDQA